MNTHGILQLLAALLMLKNINETFAFRCTEDSDCEFMGVGVICRLNQQCGCPERSFRQNGVCVLPVSASCSSTRLPCLENAECVSRNCQCIPNYHYTKRNGCVRYPKIIGDSCDKKNSCEPFPNAECLNGQCRCRSQYVEIDGQCFPGAGASCKTSSECKKINPTSKCSQKRCQCPRGTTLESNSIRCMEFATKVNEDCHLLKKQCPRSLNTLCLRERCQCSRNFIEISGNCVSIPEDCNSSSDCLIENVQCSNGKCVCPDTHRVLYFPRRCQMKE